MYSIVKLQATKKLYLILDGLQDILGNMQAAIHPAGIKELEILLNDISSIEKAESLIKDIIYDFENDAAAWEQLTLSKTSPHKAAIGLETRSAGSQVVRGHK